MAGQLVFFDLEDCYARLSKSGDPLERLSATVDFEPFRYRLPKALKRSDGSKGGRSPYDPVLMFKILILQALYGLSDEQAEFQIRDRLSFMRFLGLGLSAGTLLLAGRVFGTRSLIKHAPKLLRKALGHPLALLHS